MKFGRIALVSSWFALFFSLPLQGQEQQFILTDITESIATLEQVEKNLVALQETITNLENALINLKAESKEFTTEFLALRDRLATFKNRYEGLLKLCKQLRKQSENLLVVAIVEGAVIAGLGITLFVVAKNR